LTDRSSSSDPSADRDSNEPSGGRPHEGEPPGLGEQFGRTRSALFGLISAHVKLARAEFGEIGGEIKRAAALGGVALMLLFLAGMLIVIGLLLYLGEAVFGSIGWGLLDGTELLLGLAALLILAIIDLGWRRTSSAFLVALGAGLVVAGLLAVDWKWVSQNYSGVPGAVVPPIVLSLIVLGVLGAVIGSGFGRGPAAFGFAVGVLFGVPIGLLGAAGPGPRVAAAIGVAVLLLFWPIVAAFFVFRHGIDTHKLRDRFVPVQTIETTKETIEWVREQMPLGRKS
jgi:uncharacterized membrane protein YqjE